MSSFFKYILFILYLQYIYILLDMIKTKTIRIDNELHKAAVFYVKTLSMHGGFSAYVQQLIKSDFKKNGMKLPEGVK